MFVGAGTIKPCIAAFGADQFRSSFVSSISTYFGERWRHEAERGRNCKCKY